jgi:tryptophan synthase alpha chain
MATRLENKFAELKQAGRKALIIYITAGMPDAEGTIEAIRRAEEAGADIIELGLPFSDPMADGPVIQTASVVALKHGMTLPKVLDIVREIRQTSQIPLVAMGYINQVYHYGFEKFVEDAMAAGLDGLIAPDVPHEEAGEMRKISAAHGFHLMEFITPGTTGERMEDTCAEASGFIYCVSNYGVTGVKEIDYSIIGKVCAEARQHTQVPLAIGFGIGTPEAAAAAAAHADGVIVGSAVVKRLLDGQKDEAMALIGNMRKALDEAFQ